VLADLTIRDRRLLRLAGGLMLAGFLAFLAHTVVRYGDAGVARFVETWVYDGLLLGAAASCLLRALLIKRERAGWALMGAGLLAYSAGEIYYAAAISGTGEVPIPSPADAGYLAFYPLAYASLLLLTRERLGSFPAVRWLDGLIAGGATAAVGAAVFLGPIVHSGSSGDTVAVATNLAYPVADLTLLSLVITVSALSAWRPGRSWLILGAGIVVIAGSDVIYLFESARGTYVEGGLLDAGWPFGVLLLAVAAWVDPSTPRAEETRGFRVALIPAAAALIAIAVQFAGRYGSIPPCAEAIALFTLLAVVLRMALSLRETQASLEVSIREALTDPLTGLANRRRLMEDLEAQAATPPARQQVRLLVMFDLDGFKAYNDSFGHPAGDALLLRLGGRLAAFSSPQGVAYRLGGDEFCLLTDCTAAEVDAIVAGATAALSEHGDGFVVTASQGSVLLPSEAASREAALQLADRRMYASKSRERASAGCQSRDVLMTALRERQPHLHDHLIDVAETAVKVAEAMGLGAEQRDEVRRAAELHDTGKMAIPDAILNKPGPLDEREWEFMRTHTVVGERIIASAPSLVPVARLVRSSHERWDGSGYPDGLRGEEIPLGSRIIAVCDAYQAMVSERPYSVAMRPGRAIEEIAQGAGRQFDPGVVEAFRRISFDRPAMADPPAVEAAADY
jgi:diguanylate cyclase (GGDEF)-like protein